MTFDEWWESDDAFKTRHMTDNGIAAAAWTAARNHFQAAAYAAGVAAEREACARVAEGCDQYEAEVLAEGGKWYPSVAAAIRARSNAESIR